MTQKNYEQNEFAGEPHEVMVDNDIIGMSLQDKIILVMGLAIMGFERLAPWQIPQPEVVFAFGLGICVAPMWVAFRAFCLSLTMNKKG